MAVIGVEQKMTKFKKIDVSKYKDGKFTHRKDDDSCAYFGSTCPVNRRQKDPKEDVCLTFCIPKRNDSMARKRSP